MRRIAPVRAAAAARLAEALRAFAVVAGLGLGLSDAHAAESCTAWPGEPRPLPAVSDPEPLRARWAALRVRDLALRAERVEASAPLEAYQLWQRILCIAPEHAAARAGLQRTRALRVFRPEVRVVRERVAPAGTRELAALLEAPISIRVAPRPRPKPPDDALAAAQRRLLDRVESLLAETEDRLRRARFEAALESAGDARSRLALVSDPNARRAREARLEVLAATAQLALGEDVAARESLSRAIAADPELELDPMKTSPKVIRALAAVRAQQEARR